MHQSKHSVTVFDVEEEKDIIYSAHKKCELLEDKGLIRKWNDEGKRV
jgi:hypothetical protein